MPKWRNFAIPKESLSPLPPSTRVVPSSYHSTWSRTGWRATIIIFDPQKKLQVVENLYDNHHVSNHRRDHNTRSKCETAHRMLTHHHESVLGTLSIERPVELEHRQQMLFYYFMRTGERELSSITPFIPSSKYPNTSLIITYFSCTRVRES